jgi:uncharacterized membrane protein YphA (DoxX/SURF4 family)
MKKTKVLYWIFTGLFAAFMVFTAIPDVMQVPDAVKFMSHLGYPGYFTPFIGIAKVLGCIAILIPGFPRIREWAYAGLFFDLVGAVYSMIAVEGIQPPMAFMVVPFVLFALSYSFSHKLYGHK